MKRKGWERAMSTLELGNNTEAKWKPNLFMLLDEEKLNKIITTRLETKQQKKNPQNCTYIFHQKEVLN
ncbi:CLUMA_CG004429, isoform A [Clunio marinus]|uniref:CLUMA_CG004429, isoform A n=1 Tax=Clunio marinus TaxID=568069 RepID=A0A1J1HX76_9DIPT|nr:CLUMA_CG004429, isoform A [Clunio marinus]